MNFISFVRQNANMEDQDLKSFIQVAINDKNFPNSSDPMIMGKYLYRKLNHQQTRGFQKLLAVYRTLIPDNEIPEKFKNERAFLDAMNYIVFLQNEDPEYHDF